MRLRSWAPLSRCYCSPMLRARQTAAALSPALAAPPHILNDLREIDFGRFKPWVLVVETMGGEGPADLLAQRGYASYASTHVNRIFVRQDVLARAVF